MKYFLIFIIIFALSSLVIFQSQTFATEHKSGQTEILFSQGLSAYFFGDYEEAISFFELVLKKNPNHIDALINMGNALNALKKYEEALSYYEKVIEIEPSNESGLGNKGMILATLGLYDEANSFFDKVLEINPNDAIALSNKGFVLLNLEQPEEALTYLDKSLAIEPGDFNALVNRGDATYDLWYCEEALLYFDKALKKEPRDTYSLLRKVHVFGSLGFPEKALLNLDKILEYDSDFFDKQQVKIVPIAMDKTEWDMEKWELLLKKYPHVYDLVSSEDVFLFMLSQMEQEELDTVCNEGYALGKPAKMFEKKITIPDWIRNNAEWWSQGTINDNDFVAGLQYLIEKDILQIPETTSTTTASQSNEIPSWIKNNADLWSQGLISDDDFVKGIQYLVEQGIIKV